MRARLIFEVVVPETDNRDAESLARAVWDAAEAGDHLTPSVADVTIVAASGYFLSEVSR